MKQQHKSSDENSPPHGRDDGACHGCHDHEHPHSPDQRGHDRHGHEPMHPDPGGVTPTTGAKYFCPMCPGVESDQPGDCPKCGMSLERNPAWGGSGKTIYTCPMHPEIRQDHPGQCPKCGMTLEPVDASPAD